MHLDPDARRALELSVGGLTATEVAAHLGYDLKVVLVLILRAMAALGARSKLEAVVTALRLELIELPAPTPPERAGALAGS